MQDALQMGVIDISILPPREGWDCEQAELDKKAAISILPPREGWDILPLYMVG